jgi:hypothetical protein
MKKIMIVFLAALFLNCSCFAADSKEYDFAADLIESLNRLQFFRNIRLDANAKPIELMSEAKSVDDKLEEAKSLMQKYMRDKDENIKRIAIDIVVAIDNFIDGNLRFMGVARRRPAASPEELKSLDNTLLEIEAKKDDAWVMILNSAVTLPTVIAEGAQNDYPSGPIPFKISKAQRLSLCKQISQSFKDKLMRFDNALEQKKQGKEFSPEDISDFMFAVALIYDEIFSDTYDEFRLKVYRYQHNF